MLSAFPVTHRAPSRCLPLVSFLVWSGLVWSGRTRSRVLGCWHGAVTTRPVSSPIFVLFIYFALLLIVLLPFAAGP
jgi:hypothetical protein